ncbi:hypothetical protein J8F10_25620 [Gemmata sp. G18]|uniref:Uncharacterized protein n=1 Tax=Gemmata palustris TaxID=2822762 RepID=A0ABS5BZH6_9BACT|nr:hypothetical protein [Gemmata palustris]MBP3958640.1 hypothetical protein [Gemmata palustris]
MNETNLSKSVASATDFLYGILADVRAMLLSLEAAMEQAGWRSVTKKIATANLNSTLQGEWLLWWCYRFYAPMDAGESFDRLVAIVCNLGPPEGAEHDYATLLAAAVRFPQPTNFDEIYNSWNSTLSVCRAALERPDISILTTSEYADFSPHASAVAAIAFPLCELTSEQEINTRLVKPLLAAEALLGAQS